MTNPKRNKEAVKEELRDYGKLIHALGGYDRSPRDLLLVFAGVRVELHNLEHGGDSE